MIPALLAVLGRSVPCSAAELPDTPRWPLFAISSSSWSANTPGSRLGISTEVRELILEMGRANPSWGAPRIHGELLELGITIAQSMVSKYLPRHRKPPSQGWRTFLHEVPIAPRPRGRTPTRSDSLDAPEPRAVPERELGEVVAFPGVGGPHHRYERRAA